MHVLLRLVLIPLLPLVVWAQSPQPCITELFVGDPEFFSGDGGPAIDAKFSETEGVAVAADGTVYVSDRLTHHIRKIDPQGIITRFAGTGEPGPAGDGGLAIDAPLDSPGALALAPDGSLYLTDDRRQSIRRIFPNGIIETVYADDSARIFGLSVAADETVYFSNESVGIFRLESDGSAELFAGGGVSALDGIQALEFDFSSVFDVLTSASGDVLVTDRGRHRVYAIAPNGIVRTLVGGGSGVFEDGSLPLETPLVAPSNLAENADGDVFISHVGPSFGILLLKDGLVYKLSDSRASGLAGEVTGAIFTDNRSQVFRQHADGSVTVVGGVDRSPSYGSGLPLDESLVLLPRGLQVDSDGRLYYFEISRRTIFRTTLDGKIELFAGGGAVLPDDGVVATEASLSIIRETAIDGLDRLYLSVDSNFGSQASILRIESTGAITRIAGGGNQSDPLLIELDPLNINFDRGPHFAVTPEGRVYFDSGDDLYEIDLDGVARRVLSRGRTSFLSADCLGRIMLGAQGFLLFDDIESEPNTIVGSEFGVGPVVGADNGAVFYRDFSGQIIRFAPDGRRTNFFPTGAGFRLVDGRVPIDSALPFPLDFAVNQEGDLFVADHGLSRSFVIRGADACEMKRPFIAALLNGASFNGFGAVPGELMSLFGTYLGAESLALGAPGQSVNDTWQTTVGGLEIWVNGVQAPIIFSRDDQAAFIIPNETSGPVRIRFSLDGIEASRSVGIAGQAFPGIFTANSSGGGQAAALNQDATINTADNPADPGSVIVLYITGAGATSPPSQTGSLNNFPLPQLVEEVEVSINFVPAIVEFAGPAPGLVSGVVQVNARIPAGTPSGAAEVQVKIGGIGSRTSPTGEWPTISVR